MKDLSVHQKANAKVFVKSENTSDISLEYVKKWEKIVYSLSTLSYKVSILLDMNMKIHLKLFDIAVTLKNGHGHWNWNEQVMFNE